MKVMHIMKHKLYYALLMAMFSVNISGCFESNSEDSRSPLGSGDNGTAVIGADDSLSVPVDSTGGSVDVLRNDNSGVQITAFDTSTSNGGNISRDGTTGIFSYVPAAAYSGTDRFTYTIRDSQGNTNQLMVHVTVNDDIIASGRDFYNHECGICHQAGTEDQQSAFNASDLAQSTSSIDYDMSLKDQLWNPPLMLYYSNLSQKEVDGLRAYIGLLRNP